MRKDPVHSPTNRAKLCDAAFFDADPTGKVLVAVEEAGRPVQRVPGVIDSWRLLGCFVRCAQEYPLFRSCHLCARLWLALRL